LLLQLAQQLHKVVHFGHGALQPFDIRVHALREVFDRAAQFEAGQVDYRELIGDLVRQSFDADGAYALVAWGGVAVKPMPARGRFLFAP
jgi:hypothetical protein